MNDAVLIDYTNYKGERSVRGIIPRSIRFGSSKWHPDPQWLMLAHDLGRDAEREFAIKDIHSWRVR